MSDKEDSKRRIANECFRKGTEAMSKENWDFAIAMFGQAVGLSPDNLLYRQTLRGAQTRKYNNNKKGAGGTAFLSLTSIRGRIRKARMQKNWDDVDKAAEEGLALNPWDAGFNAEAAEACRQRGYGEVAAWCFSKAAESAPENKDYLTAWAELLESRSDFDAAIKVVERLHRLDPQNGQTRSWISKLHTSKTIMRGKFDEAESTQDVKKQPIMGYEQSVKGDARQEEASGPGMSLEADLQRAIRKDPRNKDGYLKLADLYRRENRLAEAVEQYAMALDASGGDPSIQENMEDVELEMARKELDKAKEAAGAGGEAEKAESSRQYKELLEKEIRVFQKRIERYPGDLKLKYEQAQRLMRANQYPLATRLLQQAGADPRLEGPVFLMLGECFIKQGQNQLALKQLERGVAKLSNIDHADQFKKGYYFIGRLREELKDTAGAIDAYTEVIAVDYDYRDARERMEKLQGRTEGNALADLM